MPPTLLTAVTVLLAWTGGINAESFQLAERIDKTNFYDKFDFLTKGKGPNPYDDHNSYVRYQDVDHARAKGIAKIQDNGDIYLGVDHTSVLNYTGHHADVLYHTGHPGRDTFRIESKKTYKHGLFIARFSHLPAVVCGTWPAFWTLGTGDWPVAGEIDLYVGWNLNTHNKPTLHAGNQHQIGNCTLGGTDQGAYVLAEDCDTYASSHASGQGCQTEEKTDGIWGSPNGGTQALLWTSDEIKIYTWPRGKEPANLQGDEIDTDLWSTTKPSLHLKTCDIDRAFQDQKLMFDIAFCGNPAGTVFWDEPDHLGEPTCAKTTKVSNCEDFVAKNPEAFEDVYFQIQDIRHFKLKPETKSSSTLATSKTASSQMATKTHLSLSGTTTSMPTRSAPHATKIAPLGSNSTSSGVNSTDGSTYVVPPTSVGTTRLYVGSTRTGSSSMPTLKASTVRPSFNSTAASKETKSPESHTGSSLASASASTNATVTPSTLARVPKVSGSSSRSASTGGFNTTSQPGNADPAASKETKGLESHKGSSLASASASNNATVTPSTLARVPTVNGSSSRSASTGGFSTTSQPGNADPVANTAATDSSSAPSVSPVASSSSSLAPGSERTTARLDQGSVPIVPSTSSSTPSKTKAAFTSTILVSTSKTRFDFTNKTSSSLLEPSSYTTTVLVETTMTQDAAADAAQASEAPSSDPAVQASAGNSSPEGLASVPAAQSLSLYPVASAGVDLRFGGGSAAGSESTPSASRSSGYLSPSAADGSSRITNVAVADASGANAAAEEMAAVTVYKTTRSTITACPSTVTVCPVGGVTTVVVPWYVTYCPVTPVETQVLETSTASPAGPEKVRVIIVKIFRIQRCPSTVPDCPVGSVGTVSATKILCNGKDCTPPGATDPPRLDVDPGKTHGTESNVRGPEKQFGHGVLPTYGPSGSDPSRVIARVTRIVRITRCPPAVTDCFVGKTTTTVLDCPGPECSSPTALAHTAVSSTGIPIPDGSPSADPKMPLSSHGNQEKGPERPDIKPGLSKSHQEKEPEHPDIKPGLSKSHQENTESPDVPGSPKPKETRVLTITRCPPSMPGCSIGSLTTVVAEASCSGPECSVATAAAQPPPSHPHKHPTGSESPGGSITNNHIADPQSGRPRCPDGTSRGQETSGKGPSPAGTKDDVPLKDSGGSAAVPGKDKGRETLPDGTPIKIHATAEAAVRFELGSGVPPGSPKDNPGKGPQQDPKTKERPKENPEENPEKGPKQDPKTPTMSPKENSKVGPNAGSAPQGGGEAEAPPSGVVSPMEKSKGDSQREERPKEVPKGSPSAGSKPNGVPGNEKPPKDDPPSDSPGGVTSGDAASETPDIAHGFQHPAQSGLQPTGSSVAQLHSGATQMSAAPRLWGILLGAVVILL